MKTEMMKVVAAVAMLLAIVVPISATLSCSMMLAAQANPFAEKLINMANNGEYPRDPEDEDKNAMGTKEAILSFAPRYGYEMGGTSEKQKDELTNPKKWGLKKDWGPPPRGKQRKGKTGNLIKRANDLLYKVAKWNLKGLSLEKEAAIKALCRGKVKKKKKGKKPKKKKKIKGKEARLINKAKKLAKGKMKKKGKRQKGPKMAKRLNYKAGGKSWKGKCRKGKQQSPININTRSVKKGKKRKLKFKLKDSKAVALHDNNRIVIGGTKGISVKYLKKKYTLKHAAFHSPGEHTFNGKKCSIEMQLKFVKKGKAPVMVAVCMKAKKGKSSKFLTDIKWKKAPKHPEKKTKIKKFKITDLKKVLKGDYFTYYGSLTTPPCTEGVRWFVMKKWHYISKKQRRVIYKMFRGNAKFARGRGNNRAVKGLRGRKVRLNGKPIPKGKTGKKSKKKKKASKKKKKKKKSKKKKK